MGLGFCPFTMRAPEATQLITNTPRASFVAAPCAGNACVAYTAITDPATGKVIGNDCRLCMTAQTINQLVGALVAQNQPTTEEKH